MLSFSCNIPAKDYTSILVLHYLARKLKGLPPVKGEWISFKELPGGEGYYPSFKKNMMTLKGAQRILDYRVFRHNFGRFPEYERHLESKYKELKTISSDLPDKRVLGGAYRHFQAELRHVRKWYGNYQQLWSEYFALKRE